ncbi:MAG: CRTAC1 family protein [Pseudomonadota bacterium]
MILRLFVVLIVCLSGWLAWQQLYAPRSEPPNQPEHPFAVGTASADSPACDAVVFPVRPTGDVRFLDATQRLGKDLRIKTFALSVADVNGDSWDDILIGAHEYNPYLFINDGGGFTSQSQDLETDRRYDRHAYTFVDLDNDGDLDIAIAGGGSDGVGQGDPNMLFRNTSQTHGISFERVTLPEDVVLLPSRSRAFVPIASADGSMVDLYLATLAREGFPNQYFLNTSTQPVFALQPAVRDFYSGVVNDHGRGTVADFDQDGKLDYLSIENRQVKIHWDAAGANDTQVIAYGSYSVKAADFNNDGLLDLFIGRVVKYSNASHVSANERGLIYRIRGADVGAPITTSFRSSGDELLFNLNQHIPANESGFRAGAGGIYLGATAHNPYGREFTLDEQEAMGEPPSFDRLGTYVWYDKAADRWHMRFAMADSERTLKGFIAGQGIQDVQTSGLYSAQAGCIADLVLMNTGTRQFDRLHTDALAHRQATVASAVADFNNDGWLDLLGIRHGEEGTLNGVPFVLVNQEGDGFVYAELPARPQDQLHRADMVAYGFFDNDDLVDAIITNGFGQVPGTWGEPQLLLNASPAPASALRLDLRGRLANRYAIGATLRLYTEDGSLLGFRQVGLNINLTQDTYTQHFGLGDQPPPYTLEVRWPGGDVARYLFDSPGRFKLEQGNAEPDPML